LAATAASSDDARVAPMDAARWRPRIENSPSHGAAKVAVVPIVVTRLPSVSFVDATFGST
jgi:hypothetical protein